MFGWLIKFLLFLFVLYFILSKFEKLFRGVFGSSSGSQKKSKRPNDGSLHIDYHSGKKKNSKDKNDFNGGEYVDYEEID